MFVTLDDQEAKYLREVSASQISIGISPQRAIYDGQRSAIFARNSSQNKSKYKLTLDHQVKPSISYL